MKAALMREYHRPLELVERPVPEPVRQSDVLVRVGGAGVCATDLHAIDGLMEPAGVTLPLVLGHENAGWVEAVGDGVTTVSAGDAVLVYPPYSCGLCVACRRGNDMHCARHDFTGLTVDGGFAEFVLVSERSLIALPAGVEPVAVAPHADAGLTAYHAVRRLAHLAGPGSTASNTPSQLRGARGRKKRASPTDGAAKRTPKNRATLPCAEPATMPPDK